MGVSWADRGLGRTGADSAGRCPDGLVLRRLGGVAGGPGWFADARSVESGHRSIWGPGAALRHRNYLIDCDADRGAAGVRHRRISDRNLPAMAAWTDRDLHRIAGGGAEHRVRHLGPVRARPGTAAFGATMADRHLRRSAMDRQTVSRSTLWHRSDDGGVGGGREGIGFLYPGDARSVSGDPALAQGGRLWSRSDAVGSG